MGYLTLMLELTQVVRIKSEDHLHISLSFLCPGDVDEMASSVDPDQSDLGLHRLPRRACPNTWH